VTDNGWSDDPTATEPVARPTSAPVADAVAYRSRPTQHRARRGQRQTQPVRRGRRVHRIVRRIELWSVLKISLFLYLCLYVAVLIALAVIWGLAYSTGSVDKVQSFLADVGLDNFRFYGDQMFRACAAIGGVLVLAATLVTVVTVALVNLISELTGGSRLTVIEEDIDDRAGPPPRGVPTDDGDNGARSRSRPAGGRVRRPVPTGSEPTDRVAPRSPDPLRSSDAPGL